MNRSIAIILFILSFLSCMPKPVSKQSAMPQIESFIKENDWGKVNRTVDDWDMKYSAEKRELRSQINLVHEFLIVQDNCDELESKYPKSYGKILGCYKKIIRHYWKRIPKETYFSKEFASDLNAKKNNILAKIKELEDKKETGSFGQSGTAQDFFIAYDSCADLESSSKTDLKEVLSCYKKALDIKKSIPRRVVHSRDVSIDLYTKGKNVSAKMTQLIKKIKQTEHERQ